MADIKAKLGVDGEASFKTAINNATKSVKEMNSALELAKSNYKATGDKAAYLESAATTLKSAIEAQKGVIENIQSALDNAKKKYGETSGQVIGWRTALNNANKKLVDMQSELANTEAGLVDVSNGMDAATTDSGELADGLDSLNKKGDLSQLKSGLDTIANTLQSAARFAMQVGKALWGGTVESSEWADSLVTMSQQFGIDTKTLQQWTYASKLIDTEVDVILKARQKMIKGLTSTSEEVQDAWETLGISTTNPDGSFKDATELMWEALEALGQIENETERDNLAMTLFGKSAAELNPLIKAGRDAWEAMMKEGQGLGAILSDKDVERLAQFNDQWQRMDSVMTAMKYKFFAALSPAMEKIADALTVASQQLSEFLESAEGQEAVGKLGDSIATFVTTLVEKLPELMPTITGLIDALTGLLGFIAEHATEITGVLGGLFVGSKVGSFGVGLAQAWTGLKGLLGLSGGAGAGAGAAMNAGSVAINVAGSAAMSVAGAATIGAASVIGLGVALHNGQNEGAEMTSHQNKVAGQGVAEDSASSGRDDLTAAWQAIDAAREILRAAQTTPEGITADVVQQATSSPEFQAAAQLLGMQGTDWVGLWQMGGFPALMGGNSYGGIFGDMKDQIEEMAEEAAEAAEAAGEEIGNGVGEGAEGSTDLSGAGQNAGSTLVAAVQSWFAAAFNAGQDLGQSVADGVQAGLGIASPSKVMQELGAYTAEGFALGIENGISDVENAVMTMTDATVGAASRTGGGGQQGMANMLANALRGVKVEIDGVTAGTVLTPTVSQILGMQADSWRYDEV